MIEPKYREIKIGSLRPDRVREQAAPDDPLVPVLVDSYEQVGILCAPIVRKVRGDKFYRFITGGRRIAAARKDMTLSSITCAVVGQGDSPA